MMETNGGTIRQAFGGLVTFMRKCLFNVLSVGPIPNHIAFIMDGNRRYAKKQNLAEGDGHKAGFLALMTMLRYSYEMGVKYVTVYAFSIDNFKRRPEEVQHVMDLMLEKIEGLLEKESIVNQYGIRIYFIGNLKLLNEPVRVAAEKAMQASANNTKAVLLICVAYTSCDEIVHAVEESCKAKRIEIQALVPGNISNGVIEGIEEDKKINGSVIHDVQESWKDGLYGSEAVDTNGICNEGITDVIHGSQEDKQDVIAATTYEDLVGGLEGSDKQRKIPTIKLVDIEKHMYMAVAPDPDILIRSSGETRLSNFLLWQTTNCPLYSPSALWPELGLRHLVWAVLNFQRSYQYVEKKRKQN
ncbi:hypothetical protein FNV43_RR19156 [Rhamnella rubrinervis]|uniref:Alkyl transferase n=1 Tax=Rhamnella rubrinervis TaxID=2594499 RepID=A0A8K0E0N0_9ROSA|nr:hypothetical protein FNV43_RR19156 [Rhamnella rubrinervis]